MDGGLKMNTFIFMGTFLGIILIVGVWFFVSAVLSTIIMATFKIEQRQAMTASTTILLIVTAIFVYYNFFMV